jgi:SNF2 family DNA or RNA helicase
VLKARNGKKIIWCRFTRDVEVIQEMLGERAVTYYGEDSKAQKVDAKRAFILDEDIEAFISNPAAAGTGVDGLQRVSSCAIYYSQSFNVVHRWQSEDRIHRIGAGDASATYIDLVARGTIDRSILSNHKKKKDLADLVLDDIRMMLKEGDEE